MKRTSLVVIIVLALVIVGVVFYLARPRVEENGPAQTPSAAAVAQPEIKPPSTSSALETCLGPVNSPVNAQNSIAALDARHKWAKSLIEKNHLDAGVAELRNIATTDPAYPAINYDLSDALLRAKHTSDAKDAIKLQLEISECLAKLPPADLQTYCKAEFTATPEGGCAPALAKIGQRAHYEAGLIDAELTRSTAAPAVARAAAPPVIVPKAVVPAPVAPAPEAVAAAEAPKPLPPPIRIKTAEAMDHVGQRATVCGAIVSKHTAEETNGKPTFVNLDRLFPNQTFTIVIWGNDSANVGEFPGNGDVCVTGTVATYRGSPQIVLHDAKSWSRSSQP